MNGSHIKGVDKSSKRFLRRHPPKWLTTYFTLEGYKDLTDEQIQHFVRDRIKEIQEAKPDYKYIRGESFIDDKNNKIDFKFFIKHVG